MLTLDKLFLKYERGRVVGGGGEGWVELRGVQTTFKNSSLIRVNLVILLSWLNV